MNTLFHDARYAMRQWRKSLSFTLTAVLTLALGIAATTAVFSLVEGVLLRPLPYADPTRLVTLGDIVEGAPDSGDTPLVTAPGARTYMSATRQFASLGAYQPSTYELSGLGAAEQINGARVTASMFQALSISPSMGRVFTQEEDDSSQHVTVLSQQTWRTRFHGDPNILGRKILLDRKSYEIIGVMPGEFEFPLVPGHLNRSELWVPMSFTQAQLVQGAGSWTYYMVGRLKPGLAPKQAQDDADAAAQEIMHNFPPALSRRRIHPVVQALDEATVAQARPLLRTLFFAVCVVLFIACANLVALLLVRVIRRQSEFALRIALGASRLAILRQSLIEALLLSTAGGLLGLVLAWFALHVGVRLLPETLPRVDSVALDWQVVAFAILLSTLAGVFCGLIPALAAGRVEANGALKESGRASVGKGHTRLRSALVVAELAVALVLLMAAGLLLRSFEKMRSVPLGFQADNTLTASYSLPKEQYSNQSDVDRFNESLLTHLAELPGVQAVGVTSMLPAANVEFGGTFTPEGYSAPDATGLNIAWIPQVMGSYFQAQGIPLLRGREFAPSDRDTTELVVIVNQTLAEHYWPGQNPIGKRLHRGPKEASLPWLTVVGEIGAVKEIAADVSTGEQIYLPANQARADAGNFAPPGMLTGTGGTIVLRARLAPDQMSASVMAVVSSIDPQLPLTHIRSMDSVVAASQAPRRFSAGIITIFAGVSVLLALMGIYGVIAFSTLLRTQEMAVRLALGSPRSTVVKLVLVSGAKLGLAGCIVGCIAAIFTTRLLRSFMFQVDSLDAIVLLSAVVIVLLIALLACVTPAWRAASLDPLRALRGD